MDLIYLDNNATTQPLPQVIEAMREIQAACWANPSSVHRFGQQARQRIELARSSVATLIGAGPRQIIFTSGGTESNNLALRGVLSPRGDHDPGEHVLITTQVEHAAIREPAAALDRMGVRVIELPVDDQGVVDPASLETELAHLGDAAKRVLVSVHWVNNETGVIEPINELVQVCRQYREQGGRVLFHTDATQAVGKLDVNVSQVPVDLMTFSGHKFHGPKGTGVLYLGRGVRLAAQQLGGPQEHDRRGGTQNTPGIVGLGVAAEHAQAFLANTNRIAELQNLRDRFESQLQNKFPQVTINGGQARLGRVWNTSNLGFPRLQAEAILLGLSEKGVCASAGAACSSGSLEPSPVLLAMGMNPIVAHGSVRFSLGRQSNTTEMEQAIETIERVVTRLARTLPMGV